MLDDFREQADAAFFEAEEEDALEESKMASLSKALGKNRLFGMTAMQRFILAALILSVACLGSILCLLATGRVAPLFLY